MRTFADHIKDLTPKFNKEITEGIVYHKTIKAVEYIDRFITYSCTRKTSTHLTYLGYRLLTPNEEIKFTFNKTTKIVYDIAENDIYLVGFQFQYGKEEEIREYYLYLPYLRKGNTIRLSGNKFLVMPMLADKVISIGSKIIFINILTARYSLIRNYYTVVVNDQYRRVPIIETVLYKNQAQKLDKTTHAKTIVMHYLLANYGYSVTMKMLLGFVPTAVYECALSKEHVVISTTGGIPTGYILDKSIYKATNIKFVVSNEEYSEDVLYVIGNIFYIIDNFPDKIAIHDLDDTGIWKRLLGEIIHSSLYTLPYLNEKISAHFKDLNSEFDIITSNKLKDFLGSSSTTLIHLLAVIFKNFNTWVMDADNRSLYYRRTYEVEGYVLSRHIFSITRVFLDISKEELRIDGAALESKMVDNIFKTYFKTRSIFKIKDDRLHVTGSEYSGDHLYFKNTAMVVEQESDNVNVKDGDANTSVRKKLVGAHATVGSILSLSKKNPNPLLRVNPYVNIDYATGTLLPTPSVDEIVRATDRMLANLHLSDVITTIDSDDDGLSKELREDSSEELPEISEE